MNNPLNNKNANPFLIAETAAQQIREASGVDKFDIAVTLGSGWGKASEVTGKTLATIEAPSITGFNASKVEGHNGTLKAVELLNGNKVLIIGARTHFYESHEPYHVRQVVHGVRTASALGCKSLILTNGAGGIPTKWIPSTVVIIKDHINATGASPIEGATFIDLTDLYSSDLRSLVRKLYPDAPQGVYLQNRGPQYETPAEVEMAKRAGADIVGMSTALEAIAARQAGMNVLGLSLITNHAAGTTSGEALSHQEVLDTGLASQERLAEMLSKIVNKITL